jgi:ABC-type glycerol-3-phosphate transport system permease component
MSMRWENIMAAAVVVTLPVILLYMLLQRYVVSSLTGGAVRG